ncbi:MAG TPA: ERF family protein [Mycobacterium sp.]|jgi:hypothetical protein
MSTTNNGSGGPIVPSDKAFMNFIERAALDPNFDAEKFKMLVDLQERVEDRQDKREFNDAMNRAQAEIAPILKDATNSFLQARYATLAAIDAVARPIYTAHGFSMRFNSGVPSAPGLIRLVCTVAHSSGHSEDYWLEIPPDSAGSSGTKNKTGIQAVGSSVTYLRRYLTCQIWNIQTGDDDDGEGSRDRPPPRTGTAGKGTTTQTKRGPDPLDEQNGTLWLKNLMAGLAQAQTVAGIDLMRNHWSVATALEKAPTLIRSQIESAFEAAYKRLKGNGAASTTPATGGPSLPDDRAYQGVAGADVEGGETDEFTEYDAMLNEVEGFDLITLGTLPTNAAWRGRLRALLPDQIDSINDAIARRTGTLRARQQG